MLDNSLTDEAMYVFRNLQTGECDEDSMLTVLKDFWTAVSRVSPSWRR
jgi:hypothetical protein